MSGLSETDGPRLSLSLLDGTYAVARLAPSDSMPDWATDGPFHSITRTAGELSIVCEAVSVPSEVRAERDWKCLEVAGPLDFSEIGIMAALTRALADAGVSVMALSTYDTDYLLVREAALDRAIEGLGSGGHSVAV